MNSSHLKPALHSMIQRDLTNLDFFDHKMRCKGNDRNYLTDQVRSRKNRDILKAIGRQDPTSFRILMQSNTKRTGTSRRTRFNQPPLNTTTFVCFTRTNALSDISTYLRGDMADPTYVDELRV